MARMNCEEERSHPGNISVTHQKVSSPSLLVQGTSLLSNPHYQGLHCILMFYGKKRGAKWKIKNNFSSVVVSALDKPLLPSAVSFAS